MHCIFRKKSFQWLAGLAILISTLSLWGCQSQPKEQFKCYPQQKCINVITQTLAKYNVAVIQVGQTVSVQIPTQQIFNINTANFSGDYHIILRLVADLLLQYETELVKIGAHTDASTDSNRAIAVTTQQAENILHFLTSHGVEARVLYAVGYGQKNHSKNQRIEIVFRFIPRNVDKEDYEY